MISGFFWGLGLLCAGGLAFWMCLGLRDDQHLPPVYLDDLN